MILRIISGCWYRQSFNKQDEKQFLPHVEDNIEFLDSEPTEISVLGEKIRIGRKSENHVILDSEKVSRVHCELFMQGIIKRWFVKDLASKRGTTVEHKNGESITVGKEDDPARLRNGDKLIIGDVTMEVEL